MKLANLLTSSVRSHCRIWNSCGPAETTIDCTFHLVDVTEDKTSIPIGRPLPYYKCLILDDFTRPVAVEQEGELFVGGVGVFAGYLGRPDLTEKALVTIDDQLFYRTGDLVRVDNKGLIHYIGRKDHQIKLHGQRIELAEIERCILDFSSTISGSVVVKWNDSHLVAYVESKNRNEEELRSHCRSFLPQFMVPSMFIILDHFPLNANGKLDRKRLPTPNFSTLSITNDHEYRETRNDVEKQIHSLWCDILHCDRISVDTSIFSIGGHSLILIQLYHRYKSMFIFDAETISIAQLFQHSTIADHARLIGQCTQEKLDTETSWVSLSLSEGKLRL